MWPKYSKKKQRNSQIWNGHHIPRIQLKKPSTLPEELGKFLNWFKYLPSKENDLMEDLKLASVADFLLAYISNKRTNFQVNRSLVSLKYGCTAVFSLS